MALFTFECSNCKLEIKKLFKTESTIKQFNCPKCNTHEHILRKVKDSYTLTYETIDNGIQPKKVVQLAGAPDMLQEREQLNKVKKSENKLE